MANPYNLSFIRTDESKGVITVVPNNFCLPHWSVRFYGNTTIVSIPISYDASAPVIDKEPTVSNYFVKVSKDNSFAKNNMSVFFPAGTFYEDFDEFWC
jgi:hypothetical protein